MQFSKKFRFLAASVLALQLAIPLGASAEEQKDTQPPSWEVKADYLALGDSLAHGVNEVGIIGLSYADFVAQALQKDNLLASYNKGFAYTGYTTKDVLADLQNDVEKTVTGFGYSSEKAKIRASVQNAEVITLTIGANDLLPILKESQATGINVGAILKTSQQTVTNIATILAEMKKINPQAQVYVMGYYNSFPYYPENLQKQFKVLLTTMNTNIKATAEKTGAIFVPTLDIVAKNVASYLPNPDNIHLSEAGYAAVANEAFLPVMKTNTLWDVSKAVQVKSETSTTAKITWQQAYDNVGVESYRIYVNDELFATEKANTTAITLNKLIENTTYTVVVKAVDGAGNESVKNPSVTFTAQAQPLFTDVANHWAKDFIQQASQAGIMKGYADGTFKPENNVTRIQAAAMLVRSLGLTTTEQAPFTDIAQYSADTQAEIAAAYAHGLIKGTNGQFNPEQPITRAQLALMIYRAYEQQVKQPYVAKGTIPFTDIASYNEETQRAIALLYEQGIVTGSNGQFAPEGPTKRSHAAKIFTSVSGLFMK
ncbi:S-layer homology domain-containing protein [Lysinibacillus piscis]|uniref:N-acetylmuramoyl-L-alanine amidase n=1 Tax=Lysinibacillus piscis TaxID=2518931 RepID=A0ABQ5NPJ5_9BACI|nr:S-layer homology domain-containing protein [Lysinibacillus sp. KH24]GLC90242.1 hypothetical protein LYSBPC_33690 [Lysinibacillus sp. KH24]